MQIVVLNGSPKGRKSVTMQYIRALEIWHPEHSFIRLDVARSVHRLERDPQAFEAVLAQVREADLVLWAFPLYYMLVCSQYKRFIELIFERGAQDAFRGRYAAALSTSIHFYDHLAHAYVRAVCDDLGMRFIGEFSAAMQDLLSADGKGKLRAFAADVLQAVAEQRPTTRRHAPLAAPSPAYAPGPRAADPAATHKRVMIVTDAEDGSSPIALMSARLAEGFAPAAEVVRLADVGIKGPCLGCLKCALDNVCHYEGKDGYIDFVRERMAQADILVFACTIRDRHISSTWRRWFDRSFFTTHTPLLRHKQFAVLIDGPLGQMPEVAQFFQTWTQMQESHLVDCVATDMGDAAVLDGLLDGLAHRLAGHSETGFIPPRTFLGVGAMKVLRDEIWGNLRWVFQADHRAYRRLGYYDFPHHDLGVRALNAALWLATKIPAVRRQVREKMVDGMLSNYQRALKREQ